MVRAEDLRGRVRLHCTVNRVAQTTGGACEKIEYRASMNAWRKLPPFNSLKDHAVTLQAIKLLKQRDWLLGARISCQAQIPVVAGPPEGQRNSATSCSLVQDVDRFAGVLPLHWCGCDPPPPVRDALRRCAGRPPTRPRCPGPNGRGSHQEGQPNLHGQPDSLPR